MPEHDADEVLTIKVAATVLDMSEQALRRRDEVGKVRTKRRPMSGYRLYPRRQVLELRRPIQSGSEKTS